MTFKADMGGETYEATYGINALGMQLKLATYDTPWVNNHIGLYGAIGVDIGGVVSRTYKVKAGDFNESGTDTVDGQTAVNGEFAIGPAFAVDIGSNRFQIGVPLHLAVGSIFYSEEESFGGGVSQKTEITETTTAIGFALTPQFRFATNKKLSLVVGADFAFDFPVSISATQKTTYEANGVSETNTTTEKAEPDSSFRFGFTPYIGVGFNF